MRTWKMACVAAFLLGAVAGGVAQAAGLLRFTLGVQEHLGKVIVAEIMEQALLLTPLAVVVALVPWELQEIQEALAVQD